MVVCHLLPSVVPDRHSCLEDDLICRWEPLLAGRHHDSRMFPHGSVNSRSSWHHTAACHQPVVQAVVIQRFPKIIEEAHCGICSSLYVCQTLHGSHCQSVEASVRVTKDGSTLYVFCQFPDSATVAAGHCRLVPHQYIHITAGGAAAAQEPQDRNCSRGPRRIHASACSVTSWQSIFAISSLQMLEEEEEGR